MLCALHTPPTCSVLLWTWRPNGRQSSGLAHPGSGIGTVDLGAAAVAPVASKLTRLRVRRFTAYSVEPSSDRARPPMLSLPGTSVNPGSLTMLAVSCRVTAASGTRANSSGAPEPLTGTV